jgi:hypothetical protein
MSSVAGCGAQTKEQQRNQQRQYNMSPVKHQISKACLYLIITSSNFNTAESGEQISFLLQVGVSNQPIGWSRDIG